MTVNAKRITMAVLIPNPYNKLPKDKTTQRWDCDVKKIDNMKTSADFDNLDTIKEIRTIRTELGNYENDGSSPNELDDCYFKYINSDSMFLRTYGSEVNLRNMKDLKRLPYLGGGYGPHIRKKIFDKDNRTRFELRTFSLIDTDYTSITEKEYDDF
jgi:hypothetical protein